jgi:hypothetical protein
LMTKFIQSLANATSNSSASSQQQQQPGKNTFFLIQKNDLYQFSYYNYCVNYNRHIKPK